MADLKPVGSEKLKGDDKLKRILELTYYKNEKDVEKVTNDYEYITESNNGVYGIVKEKDGYYVKRGLNESNLDYIGGLFMKNKNKFSSYAEALKRLELLKGQENLQEATKYVLKNKTTEPKPDVAPETPDPVLPPPMSSEIPSPEAEVGGEIDGGLDLPTETDDEMDGETGIKIIQKLTGRLGEKIRSSEDELDSKDLKYVLNSIISAIDITKLDEDDLEDILSNFDADNQKEFDSGGVEDETSFNDDDVSTENELGEMDALQNLIDTEFYFDDRDVEPHDDFKNTQFDVEDIENGDTNDESDIYEEDDENSGAYISTKNHYDDETSNHDAEIPDIFEDENLDFGDNDGVREFDIDEITEIVNKVIKDNLQNYFK